MSDTRKFADRDHSHLVWDEVSRETVYQAKVFEVQRLYRNSRKGGLSGTFHLVHTNDWVNVVALTRDSEGRDCFVMVWQYRQGGQMMTLEFPGGLVDKNEAPETAAARELMEETGYRAGNLTCIGSVNPNPAIHDNTAWTFLARDLTALGTQELDEHELLDWELVPVQTVLNGMGSAPFGNGVMVLALHWYRKWLETSQATP